MNVDFGRKTWKKESSDLDVDGNNIKMDLQEIIRVSSGASGKFFWPKELTLNFHKIFGNTPPKDY
jgi:hypothetical protein